MRTRCIQRDTIQITNTSTKRNGTQYTNVHDTKKRWIHQVKREYRWTTAKIIDG